jgi:hypothetical protein
MKSLLLHSYLSSFLYNILFLQMGISTLPHPGELELLVESNHHRSLST